MSIDSVNWEVQKSDYLEYKVFNVFIHRVVIVPGFGCITNLEPRYMEREREKGIEGHRGIWDQRCWTRHALFNTESAQFCPLFSDAMLHRSQISRLSKHAAALVYTRVYIHTQR